MDAHRKAIIHGSGQSCWRTPPQMATRLIALHYCAIDLAATREDRQLPAWLGPGSPWAEDALAVGWYDTCAAHNLPPIGFVNPPYSLSERRELRKQLDANDVPEQCAALAAQIRALNIAVWAEKAFEESRQGFTTIGVFPYAPQTTWFRRYVMGHTQHVGIRDGREIGQGWSGHAALDYWRIPHRVSYLQPDGSPSNNAGVNTCVIQWGPNPGFVGPWVPSGRYWSYR